MGLYDVIVSSDHFSESVSVENRSAEYWLMWILQEGEETPVHAVTHYRNPQKGVFWSSGL